MLNSHIKDFDLPRMRVAADGGAADAIAQLRSQLAGGGEVSVNQDGTVKNDKDPMSQTSISNGEGFKPVDKAVVAERK